MSFIYDSTGVSEAMFCALSGLGLGRPSEAEAWKDSHVVPPGS